MRIAILVIEFVLGALVQPATAREDQQISISTGFFKLAEPELTIAASPIEGLKASELRDTFDEIHNGHRHEAIDIIKPKGTPARAVVDGTIRKLFFSKGGGNTIYEFDKASVYCYYYAHLDRYADGLHEGMRVSRGTVIGYIGSSGNALPAVPHLHFSIYRLGPDKQWWKGTALNPYPVLIRLLKRSASKIGITSQKSTQSRYPNRGLTEAGFALVDGGG
jgi:murein DD-endopeptidase MepM/ murein hydrolase activator NlpD